MQTQLQKCRLWRLLHHCGTLLKLSAIFLGGLFATWVVSAPMACLATDLLCDRHEWICSYIQTWMEEKAPLEPEGWVKGRSSCHLTVVWLWYTRWLSCLNIFFFFAAVAALACVFLIFNTFIVVIGQVVCEIPIHSGAPCFTLIC